MDKISTIILVTILVSGCVSMESIKNNDNKISLILDHNYEVIYRTVVKNSQDCLSPQQVIGNIYLDNKTATITEVAPPRAGFPYYTIDIVALSNNKTALSIYTAFSWQRETIPGRIRAWLDEGSTKCKYNGFPRFGPD
jgi:hypothetical protein